MSDPSTDCGVLAFSAPLVDDSAHLLRGSKGRVAIVQKAVQDLGEQLPKFGADGRYGGETEAGVVSSKSERGIFNHAGQIDGVVGKKTIARLDQEIAAFDGEGVVPPTGGA